MCCDIFQSPHCSRRSWERWALFETSSMMITLLDAWSCTELPTRQKCVCVCVGGLPFIFVTHITFTPKSLPPTCCCLNEAERIEAVPTNTYSCLLVKCSLCCEPVCWALTMSYLQYSGASVWEVWIPASEDQRKRSRSYFIHREMRTQACLVLIADSSLRLSYPTGNPTRTPTVL